MCLYFNTKKQRTYKSYVLGYSFYSSRRTIFVHDSSHYHNQFTTYKPLFCRFCANMSVSCSISYIMYNYLNKLAIFSTIFSNSSINLLIPVTLILFPLSSLESVFGSSFLSSVDSSFFGFDL